MPEHAEPQLEEEETEHHGSEEEEEETEQHGLLSEEEETEHHGSEEEEETETEHHGSALLSADWGNYISIITEILTNLPLKPVFMAKCVSKKWHSLISDPSFAKSYTMKWNKIVKWKLLTRFLLNDNGAVINTKDNDECSESQGFALRFLPSHECNKPVIIASDNGLLLCSYKIRHYYVCNPITMKWVSLPEPNQNWESVNTGLIFNKINNSYKVVRIPAGKFFNDEIRFEIFSSETREWRDSKVKVPSGGYKIKPDPLVVSFNGYLHFHEFRQNKIIVFDPNQEQQEQCLFDLPEHEKIGTRRGIGVCCDELCYYDVTDLGYLSKWVLVDYENRIWEMKNRVNFSQLWTDDDDVNIYLDMRRNIYLYPLVIHPFDSDVMYYKLGMNGCLVSCSLETGKLELIKKELDYGHLLAFLVPPWPTTVSLHDEIYHP